MIFEDRIRCYPTVSPGSAWLHPVPRSTGGLGSLVNHRLATAGDHVQDVCGARGFSCDDITRFALAAFASNTRYVPRSRKFRPGWYHSHPR